MRTPGLFLALALAAAAATAAPPESATPTVVPTATRVSKVLLGEVVATDGAARTITYRKSAAGDERTAAVDDKAAAKVRELAPGDKVTLTLRETDGEETVVAVKRNGKAAR